MPGYCFVAMTTARLQRILFEAMNLTPLFLVGFVFALGGMLQGLLLFMQGNLRQPLVNTGLCFGVHQRGQLGWPTLLIETGDLHFPAILIFANRNYIADLKLFSGLATLAVDMHLAAINGFGSQTAGFKKPRGPQPFIDAFFVKLSQLLNHSPPKPCNHQPY